MGSTTSTSAAPRGVMASGGARLLEDKLQIPQPSLTILRRRRITDQLERAAGHRVTVVSAPAGSGKTVAAAAWAAVTPASRRIAWLTLDAADAEPARFWAYISASLTRARLAPAEVLRSLADASAGNSADTAALCLVDAAQRLTEPVFLILDDVHELADSAVLSGLDLVIRHAPPALHLILSGRCAPGLQLARMRLSGEVADIGPSDLACTAAEADAYFEMMGLRVDPSERDQLLKRTEGWMAGLRLAAMRTSARPAAPVVDDGRANGGGPVTDNHLVTDIAGNEPIVTEYLSDEVLLRQSPQTRLFLLRTSVTERISGDLADALTGTPGGARTLERLRRTNNFVEMSGSNHDEYRYHPLLRELLAAEVHREIPHEVPVLLRRAARWQAAHGQVIDAVFAAAEAGDWDYAAHVLAEAGTATLLRGGPAELERALALFPADRCADDAALAAALAAARLWSGDADGAACHLEDAQRALGRCAQADRRVIEPWLVALRVMKASSQAGADPGVLGQARAHAERAQATAGTLAEHRSLGLLWFALGTARLRRWEIRDAWHALDHAERQLTAGGLDDLQIRARVWQVFAEAWYGNLARADRLADELADRGCGRKSRAGYPVLLAAAQASLIRDDLPAVNRLLDEADEAGGWDEGRLPGEPDMREVAAMIRARARLAAGDINGARGLVIRLRGAEAWSDPPLKEFLAVLDTEIALRAGDSDRARMAVTAGDDGPFSDSPSWRLARGRVLLSEGDFQGALEAIEPCLDDSTEGVILGHKIAAMLVAAVAHRRQGRSEAAAGFLEQALALAEPDDACREFLDAGQAVRSGLTVLVMPTSPRVSFARRILNQFEMRHAQADEGPVEVGLTDSELAVLRFLPTQMTNQEIAEALYLSINTVKTHLRSAYRKLGVASRRDAMARGRQLQLL